MRWKAFRVDALDYLLKPFNYTEFLRAATKAFTMERMSGWKTFLPTYRILFFVKSDYKLIQIQLKDILYIEGLKRLHSHPNRGQGGRYSHADEHEEYRGPSPRRHIHPGTPFLYCQYQQN